MNKEEKDANTGYDVDKKWPERRKTEVCRFFLRDACRYTADTCRFMHEKQTECVDERNRSAESKEKHSEKYSGKDNRSTKGTGKSERYDYPERPRSRRRDDERYYQGPEEKGRKGSEEKDSRDLRHKKGPSKDELSDEMALQEFEKEMQEKMMSFLKEGMKKIRRQKAMQ